MVGRGGNILPPSSDEIKAGVRVAPLCARTGMWHIISLSINGSSDRKYLQDILMPQHYLTPGKWLWAVPASKH